MQAMNLDGGTSAILWYDGEYVTRCSNTALPEGRTLPNAFVYKGGRKQIKAHNRARAQSRALLFVRLYVCSLNQNRARNDIPRAFCSFFAQMRLIQFNFTQI